MTNKPQDPETNNSSLNGYEEPLEAADKEKLLQAAAAATGANEAAKNLNMSVKEFMQQPTAAQRAVLQQIINESEAIQTIGKKAAKAAFSAVRAISNGTETARLGEAYTSMIKAVSSPAWVSIVESTAALLGEVITPSTDSIIDELLTEESEERREALRPFVEEALQERIKNDPDLDSMRFGDFQEAIRTDTDLRQSLLEAAKDRERRKTAQQAAQQHNAAKQANVVTTLGGRLTIPTSRVYRKAFWPLIKKEGIGIFRRDAKTGSISKITGDEHLIVLALFRLIKENNSGEVGEVTMHISDILTQLGIDPTRTKINDSDRVTRAEARQAFIDRTIALTCNLWGVIPGSDRVYQVVSVHSYSLEDGNLYIYSPLLGSVLRSIDYEREQAEKSGHGYEYGTGMNDFLLHATIANERDKAAVQVVEWIIGGLILRGNTPDSKLKENKKKHYKDRDLVTYNRLTFKGAIIACPLLQDKLDRQKTTSAKTTAIQRTFKSVYRILRKKTDLYQYYRDFHVREIVPNMSELDQKIIITHHGENPNYQQPLFPMIDANA